MTSAPINLSICIASYKAKDLLINCLETVVKDPPNTTYEIVVVNDYSGDGTAEAVAFQFPDVQFIENPGPVGISKAFNMAFSASSGRYILQLSADVTPEPGALDKLFVFMESHPDTGMAGAQLLNPDGSLQPCGRRFPTLISIIWNKLKFHLVSPKVFFNMTYRNYNKVEEVDEMPNACLIIRRETIDQVGILDENLKRFYDDVEWCLRIKKGGWKVYNVPQAQVIHHWYYKRAPDATFLIQTGYFSELYVFKKHYKHWEFQTLRLVEVIEVSFRMMKWALSWLMHPRRRSFYSERLHVGRRTIKMAFTMD